MYFGLITRLFSGWGTTSNKASGEDSPTEHRSVDSGLLHTPPHMKVVDYATWKIDASHSSQEEYLSLVQLLKALSDSEANLTFKPIVDIPVEVGIELFSHDKKIGEIYCAEDSDESIVPGEYWVACKANQWNSALYDAEQTASLIKSGKPPALPGDSQRFDRSRGLSNLFCSITSNRGTIHERLQKSGTHEMGL